MRKDGKLMFGANAFIEASVEETRREKKEFESCKDYITQMFNFNYGKENRRN